MKDGGNLTVFYTTLLSTYLLGLASRKFKKIDKNLEPIIAAIIILIFILVAGLRWNIGDTHAYREGYENLANFTGFTDEGKDKGFTVFSLFLYNISPDPQLLIFASSLIIQFFNVHTLYRYKDNNYFELEIYMYITSGCFLVTMNGMRQAMAGGILFALTHLIIKGKFIPYAILVWIISSIHASALIMIPVYFLCREEAWSKKTKIIIVLASIGFLCFYQLMPAMFDALGDSTYTEYEELMTEDGAGASPTRFIVNAVPVVLAYWKREKLKEVWSESNVFVNMSLVNCIIMAFSLYNWIFARFQIYFQLYNFVLLPYIIKNCFTRKERDLIYYCFIVCYFIFFYYEQVIGGNGLGYISHFF